jgi:hypothetical protein
VCWCVLVCGVCVVCVCGVRCVASLRGRSFLTRVRVWRDRGYSGGRFPPRKSEGSRARAAEEGTGVLSGVLRVSGLP